eukprot:CAMPEP_0195537646 /NCGR_PEP_ID=MMETSP0794_2-20130614/48316_1 /TAXON_ID=515487 /ORGANISM="Stephanopyxis turris, Strain CCMP 815" /LENGTH=49 /DNA_ID= /DNA_START= /DNA_END= /DNA_ORIENTATION=
MAVQVQYMRRVEREWMEDLFSSLGLNVLGGGGGGDSGAASMRSVEGTLS